MNGGDSKYSEAGVKSRRGSKIQLEGATRRAIDIHEGDTIDKKAFKALVRAAVALNTSARG